MPHTLSPIILEGLDNAWNPLLERLAGVSDDEYTWEPTRNSWPIHPSPDDDGVMVADWADPDPVPAPVTTIAWRCWGPFADHTNLALAIHAEREVIHHGAEIALLRDLYAGRS